MTSKHQTTREFELYIDGICLAIEAAISFDFTPEVPATGMFGRPEDYDCGAGALVEIDTVPLTHAGKPLPISPEFEEMIIANLDLDVLAERAAEGNEGRDEAAREMRDELRRELV
jgi:hypothetical protein